MMEVDIDEDQKSEEIESSDSDNEEELSAMADSLENQITENIFSYQSHIDLIAVLKRIADLNRLRIARNRMAKQFPLAPELWIEWLEDEIKIANTTEERNEVLNLFERAVKDYLSIEIWMKYLEFSIDTFGCENECGIGEVRKICENSLTAGGLHVTKGSFLWHSYIKFENRILETLQENPDAHLNQLRNIAKLYKRLLSCPLINIDENYKEFTVWLESLDESLKDKIIEKTMVEDIYKRSKDKLLKIKVYEDALISDPDHAIDHYKDYLNYEKSKAGSPVRVQFLYERMICDFCLHEEIWLEYITFVSTVLNNRNVVFEVIQRSLRNCPWSYRLYQCYMRTLEKYRCSHESITGTLEQAIASGLQTAGDFREVWMSYLEYLRRRFDEPGISRDEEEKRMEELRANFAKASDFLSELDGADPHYVVIQFWARIEAIYCKNMEKSRLLWNEILSVDINRTSEMWLEYINIERAFGDSKHLRKLFPRALQNTNDYPERITNSWLNYERDEGTLESYEYCLEKVKLKFTQINEEYEREVTKQKDEAEKAKELINKKSRRHGASFKGENSSMENNSETERNKKLTGHKRKLQSEVEDYQAPSVKKTKNEESEELVKNLLEESERSHGITVLHDSSKDDRTVFVSNLDFATQESTIRDIFDTCGKITDLRLVKDYKGRSKGYCYVEFEKVTAAAKALKKDREPINGRPMFVSKCDPDKETRSRGFKYSCKMEKNKLFIRGLPFTTTEGELRELFGKYGSLKDVRLVTYRNGHSKGLAYVEYEDEVDAAQAIIKTDGVTVGDRQISVAISNPPDRKTESVNRTVSLGGGSSELGPRGRGRTQISFLPRSVQLNKKSPTAESMANLSFTSDKVSEKPKKLNNSDFRTMIN